jgi:hypothetical protein
MKSKEVALEQIKLAVDWIVGSYDEDIEDGLIKRRPSRALMADEIYEHLMHWTLTEFGIYSEPNIYMRLAGSDFIKANIAQQIAIYKK